MAEVNTEATTTGGTPENQQQTTDAAPPTFDAWLEGQDETVRGLIDGHVAGLRSALDSERSQRKELAKALKDASKDLEEGSKAREALESLSGRLEAHEQQVAAYEVLSQAGVADLRLAYIAAREAGFVRKDGTVNVEQLREQHPALFKARTMPQGNAGSGAGANGVPPTKDMNAFIRLASGRNQ